MKIDNQFVVHVPRARAWEVLTDLENVAPCLPGAQLTGVEGDTYTGKVKIKLGPIVSEYTGTARFLERDDGAHRAVIEANGKDSRGAGNASATIHAQLSGEGSETVVSVSTDLNITGKVAQFGSGMIKEVSEKLLGQFVANLESRLIDSPPADSEAPTAPAGADRSAEPVPAAPRFDRSGSEAPPVDVMDLAGASLYRRLIPVAVGAIAVGIVIYLRVR